MRTLTLDLLERVAKLPPPSVVSSKVSWLPTSQPVLVLVSACGETTVVLLLSARRRDDALGHH